MDSDIENHDDITVLRPGLKRLEANTVRILRGDVLELLKKGRVNILCDLQDVEFIDSSGMGVLVAVNHMVLTKGRLLFCNMNERLHGVFTMTRLDNLLKVHPGSITEAMDALRAEMAG